jgi:predicted MFS family arabinose efflux permease
MRKRIILTAMAAVAVIAFAWSMSTLPKPKNAGTEEATEASASISPHDMTIKQGNILPVEYWSHPF